jgi:hypothetical protein
MLLPHFADEEVEAQRDEVTSLRTQLRQVVTVGAGPKTVTKLGMAPRWYDRQES